MNITTIDVGYLDLPGAANAFLVRGPRGDALVECGTAATWCALRAGLHAAGSSEHHVVDLLLTHIHLDHAGAAGHLAALGARVHAHPFGVPHLVDPAKLAASSRRVHGPAYDRFYGDLLPVPAELARAVEHDADVEAAGLAFRALHTPGHARHHVAWLLEHGDERHAFLGDLAGIVVPGSAFIAMPTPPPEFDPPAWQASLLRVIDARPTHLWLTHGGLAANGAESAHAFLRRALERLGQEAGALRELVARFGDSAEAVDAYRALQWPWAERDGVDAPRRAEFLDDAFLRMNLGGARRAFMPRP